MKVATSTARRKFRELEESGRSPDQIKLPVYDKPHTPRKPKPLGYGPTLAKA